jgi:methionine sulfoxide reductase heme-binding subunit
MDLARHTKWLKPPVFLLCLAPLGNLAWKAFNTWKAATTGHAAGPDLGANPVQVIQFSTGTWTLVFLCVTLAITPLRKLLYQNVFIRFRRMFGLFAFFYGTLHFITYLWLDQAFDFPGMLKDVYKRPFIAAGFAAFVLMTPLALTSTAGWIRRLGGRRWQLLHRLIYVSAIAGVVHFYWGVKVDETVPYRFAAVVAVLLGYRLIVYYLESKKSKPASGRPEKQTVLSA